MVRLYEKGGIALQSKQIIGLAAAVVVLIGYLMMSGDSDVAVNQIGDSTITLSSIKADQATTITVKKGETELLSLNKTAAGWTLASGHPADAKKVEDLLKNLADAKAEERRVNLDQLATYGLGDAKLLTVVSVGDSGGKELARVQLGKKGPDWGSAWAQRDAKQEVLLLNEGPLGRLVDGEFKLKGWLDKQPAKTEATALTKLSISGELQVELSRSDAAKDAGPALWSNAAGEAMDTSKVDALLSHLSGLYIDDIASAESSPILTLTAVTNGAGKTMVLGRSGDKDWQLKVGDHAYKVSENSAKTLRNKVRELLGQAALD
jgi:hypothetical protein